MAEGWAQPPKGGWMEAAESKQEKHMAILKIAGGMVGCGFSIVKVGVLLSSW